MGTFRQPYGQGMGFANHFASGGPGGANTAGLFTSGDTTPDVTVGDLFIANNTSATIITYFDLQNYANRSADYFGKRIKVLLIDQGSTSLANNAQLYLFGTDNLATKNTYALHEFAHVNSAWVQTDYAKNNRRDMAAVNIGGTLGIDVDDRRVIQLVGTGGATNTLASLSNGQVGQLVTVFSISGGANIVVNSAGNILLMNTNAVTLLTNNTYTFVKLNSAQWAFSRPNLFV